MSKSLEELLARATAMEAQVQEATEARARAALEEKVALLEQQIKDLLGDGAPATAGELHPALDPAAPTAGDLGDLEDLDAELGTDFDPEDLEDPDAGAGGEAKALGPCPACGSTDRDDFADGTARCTDCGMPLDDATKGYDFVDLDEPADPAGEGGFDFKAELTPDEHAAALELDLKEWTRDKIGRFAATSGGSGAAVASTTEKPKPNVRGEGKTADDYQLEDLDDVRSIMHSWTDVPAKVKAALKRRMVALVARESRGKYKHERLTALVAGLGDGDGKHEAGEGSGRALRDGREGDWLANHRKGDQEPLETKGGLSEFEVLLARRAALSVD